MYKVSSKRQITLPKVFCERMEISPGDFIEFFEYDGKLTLVKKEQGYSKGSMQHLKAKADMSDEDSLLDAVSAS